MLLDDILQQRRLPHPGQSADEQVAKQQVVWERDVLVVALGRADPTGLIGHLLGVLHHCPSSRASVDLAVVGEHLQLLSRELALFVLVRWRDRVGPLLADIARFGRGLLGVAHWPASLSLSSWNDSNSGAALGVLPLSLVRE